MQIDPDELDSEEEEEGKEEQGNKRSRSPSPPISAQRPRLASESLDHPSDMESMATFSGTGTVMKWDLKYSRLFALTFRCLSDIQEYSNQRESMASKDGQ
jgi:hypothetical protein